MTLGYFISKYRADHGLSQLKFAEICGLSNGYISMLERGFNPNTNKPIVPSLMQLKKIADGMNMTVMRLLDEVEDMPIDLSIFAEQGQPENIIPMPEMR